MEISMYIMAVSGLLLVTFFLLFKTETVNGHRVFLRHSRNNLDAIIFRQMQRWESWKRYVGASSFRLFLHYMVHQLLSTALSIVKKLERLLNRLKKHNRSIAKDVKSARPDNHLSHIAAHKASTALSSEEQRLLRERTLND